MWLKGNDNKNNFIYIYDDGDDDVAHDEIDDADDLICRVHVSITRTCSGGGENKIKVSE